MLQMLLRREIRGILMEGIGKTVRIDFLKVKQKIFDAYPVNSLARKVILKEEKVKELQKLTMARNIFSKDFTDSILETTKHHIYSFALKVIGYFGLASLSGLFGILAANTRFELTIFFATSFALAFMTGRSIARTVGEYTNYREMATEQNKIDSRIKKLQGEINKL